MRWLARPLGFLALTFTLVHPSTPAFAQASKRTFVSAAGNDSNASLSPACPVTAPCRTFGGAYAQTIPDGEINVLDPAGYGTLNITHGLSIVGHGWAAITAQAGNAITISAGASDKVFLRGLQIDGAGTGVNGVVFNSGRTLVIEDTVIRNFSTNGIAFTPGTFSNLVVSRTTSSDNGANGILVRPTADAAYGAVFDTVRTYNNPTSGITLDGSLLSGSANIRIDGSAIDCIASDSDIAVSNSIGFQAISSANHATVVIKLTRSSSIGNHFGAVANGSTTALLASGSDLGLSLFPWLALNSGKVFSYGDNDTFGNPSPGNVIAKN